MATILRKSIGSTGYGMMGLTWRPVVPTEKQAIETMKAALENGANFWNGGIFYGTEDYNSLHLLRTYFTMYPDDAKKTVLCIKGCINPETRAPDGRPEAVRRSVDYCLEQLEGKKFLDLFECARVDPEVPIEETIQAIAEYVKDRKVGGISLSEVSADTIRRAHKIHPISGVEVELSLWATDILNNGIASTCGELGIPVFAYSPLGAGFLTGKFTSHGDLPADDRRRNLPKVQPEVFDKNFELVRGLKLISARKGCTNAQVALAWIKTIQARPGMPVIIPIPGATTKEKVAENMQDIILSDTDMADLDRLLSKNKVVGERYGGQAAVYING